MEDNEGQYVPAGEKSYLCKKCYKRAEFLLIYYDLRPEHDQVEKGACKTHLTRVFKERKSRPNELIDLLDDWSPRDDILASMVEETEESGQKRIKL